MPSTGPSHKGASRPATGAPRRWSRSLAWLPVPLFIVLYVVFGLREPNLSFEPRFVLPALNIVFITGVSFLVAYLAARSYVSGESLAVLLIGSGMLAFGLASVFAAVSVLIRLETDTTVTVYNVGAWIGGLCCFASALLAIGAGAFDRPGVHSRAVAFAAYAMVVLLIVGVAVLDFGGRMPVFFVPGHGPTVFRQVVLGSAVVMFVLSALLFMAVDVRSPSPFISWYSLSLLLIALGLSAVFTQREVGSVVSWLGRSAQYLGCVYMYVALLSVPVRARPWRIPLDRILTEALRATEHQLRHQNAILEGVGRILREALTCDTEEELGRTCLTVAEDVTESAFGFIGEINAEGRLDDIAISDPGWEACRMPRVRGARAAPTGFIIHGIYGRVVLDGRAFFTNDPPSHPDRIGVPEGHPSLSSFLGAPLIRNGKTTGMIAVANRPGGYRQEDLEALTSLATAIVQAFMRNRAERALRAALAEAEEGRRILREEDRRKNEFLATLSHELRNPLAPMRYALDLLDDCGAQGSWCRTGEPSGPKRVIERQLSHLVHLVDDLLDVTRIASNKVRLRKERVELASIVRHAVEAVTPEIHAAEQALDVRVPDDAVWLDADPDRLAQVLINLMNNAGRYTPEQGRISLVVEATSEAVEISVADTGVGLRAEDLERVFEMFMQVGEPGRGGLGIGLALVKGIVELHGGTVEAKSGGPGKGSEFTIRLPRAQPPQVAAGGDALLVPEAAAPARILIVDDNADAADMLKIYLAMKGHDVRVAADGASALASLDHFDATIGLFDIGLPGMSGNELAARVRDHPRARQMYLIAITGWGQESDRQRSRDSGFNAHLTKPADPRDISRLIAEAQAMRV